MRLQAKNRNRTWKKRAMLTRRQNASQYSQIHDPLCLIFHLLHTPFLTTRTTTPSLSDHPQPGETRSIRRRVQLSYFPPPICS